MRLVGGVGLGVREESMKGAPRLRLFANETGSRFKLDGVGLRVGTDSEGVG